MWNFPLVATHFGYSALRDWPETKSCTMADWGFSQERLGSQMASSSTSLQDGFTVGDLGRVKAKAGRIAVEKFSCGHSTWAQSAAELAAYLSAKDGSLHFYCYHSGADGTKDDWG